MGETTFAQSYFHKTSLLEISFDELEALSRTFGYTMRDLHFVLDYNKAADMASRMGCKSIYEYHQRWDQSLHLPYFPDIFYAGRGWLAGVDEEDAWKHFIFSHSGSYRTDHSPSSESGREGKTAALELPSSDPGIIQDPTDIHLPAVKEAILQKPAKPVRNCYDYVAAKQAVIKFGFRSSGKYYTGRWQDPLLPANPAKTYGDKFEGWLIFLGLCSIKETWEIIRKENCRFGKQYFELAKRFPKMPLHPSIYGVKWKNLSTFMMAAYAQK